MNRGWVDITEQSGADRPAEGATRIIRQAGLLYRQEFDGTLALLGGGAGTASQRWRDLAFAYAYAFSTSIKSDFLVDFDKGVNGDYGSGTASNGTVTLITTANGGVARVSVSALANATIGVFPLGSPSLIANIKTSTPWVFLARAQFTPGTVDANTDCWLGLTNPASQWSSWITCGISGAGSITNWGLAANAGAAVAAGGTVAIDTTKYVDIGMTYDGTTVTGVVGQLSNGSVASTGATLNNAQVPTTTGMPAGFVRNQATAAVRTMDVDKIFFGYVLP